MKRELRSSIELMSCSTRKRCRVTMSSARAAQVKESNGQSSSRTRAQHRGTWSRSSESSSQQLISGLTKNSSCWIVRSKQFRGWLNFYKFPQNYYLGKPILNMADLSRNVATRLLSSVVKRRLSKNYLNKP